jgi:PTH1 family peptidyl-tRNA hydrolase
VTLAAPLAWMNQVGPTVNALMGELACVLSDLLVIHDDLDLPLGRLRIKRRGGAGGHNGVRSVIDAVGAEEFCRLKIGIGRPAPGVDPAEYVLSSFVPSDIRLLDPVLAQAVQALECWAAQGVEATMNRFNVREKEEGDE